MLRSYQKKEGEHKETLGGAGYVCSLDCGDGSMGECTVELIELYTLSMCSFLHSNYTSIKVMF